MVFLDPPWGGPQYGSGDADLCLGGMLLSDLVALLLAGRTALTSPAGPACTSSSAESIREREPGRWGGEGGGEDGGPLLVASRGAKEYGPTNGSADFDLGSGSGSGSAPPLLAASRGAQDASGGVNAGFGLGSGSGSCPPPLCRLVAIKLPSRLDTTTFCHRVRCSILQGGVGALQVQGRMEGPQSGAGAGGGVEGPDSARDDAGVLPPGPHLLGLGTEVAGASRYSREQQHSPGGGEAFRASCLNPRLTLDPRISPGGGEASGASSSCMEEEEEEEEQGLGEEEGLGECRVEEDDDVEERDREGMIAVQGRFGRSVLLLMAWPGEAGGDIWPGAEPERGQQQQQQQQVEQAGAGSGAGVVPGRGAGRGSESGVISGLAGGDDGFPGAEAGAGALGAGACRAGGPLSSGAPRTDIFCDVVAAMKQWSKDMGAGTAYHFIMRP